MPLPRRHIGSDLDQSNLSTTRMRRFVRDYFAQAPICFQDDMTAADGTTGATNVLNSGKYTYEYFILGAGQTITKPTVTADGLLISLDLTDDEGIILSPGILSSNGGSFTPKSDRAFYVEATLKLADASGLDDFFFGFAKNQAYQTVMTSFTDYFGLGFNTSANPAVIKTRWALNGTDGSLDTTQTWADGATKTLRVAVDDAGYGRCYIDGIATTVQKTDFVFDTGDVVNWLLFALHATVAPGTIHLSKLEWGYSPRRGE